MSQREARSATADKGAMRHTPILGTRFFFATGLLPCPYLSGRLERRVVTEISGRDAAAFHDVLSWAGFRRSHDIAYAPACPDCVACQPVRVLARRFTPTRWQRRILRNNRDVATTLIPPVATQEQYALFASYQQMRHGEGDMARMDQLDYRALVENTPIETQLLELRLADGALAGACLLDPLSDGLSCVYSFFEPGLDRRSLGSFMILWVIERVRRLGLPHVYLGFHVEGCAKMSYKTRFRPLEVFVGGDWRPVE
jgi:leucyl-tRNA---protein transferase